MEPSNSRDADYYRRRKISMEVNINDLIRDLLKVILMGNLALSTADDLGNIGIMKQALNKFGVTFNRQRAKEFILKAADQIYQIISKDVENSYPSLMFDSATRHNRNVFLGNIRYIKYGKICNRTLGVLTQLGPQFGAVPVDQLASLMQKVGKTVDDIYSTCYAQRLPRITGDAESDSLSESENEESENQQVDEEAGSVNLINETVGMLHTKIFCGTQEYEQAVKDVTEPFEGILQEIRKFAKNAKSQKHDKVFVNLKRPRKDTAPGWDSTYMMISDFSENAAAYKAIPYTRKFTLSLNADAWSFIEEYAKVFKPVHLALKDFQREDYTMSDFYLRWKLMEIHIKKIPNGSNNLQTKLLKEMSDRSQKFFDYDAFISALILDPRFAWNNSNHATLNEAARIRGINHITKIHECLIARQMRENPTQPEPSTAETAEEALLTQLLGGGSRGSTLEFDKSVDINQQIMKFIFTEPRLGPSGNFSILKYWSLKQYDPEWRALYRVSQVVYGTAFSQVKAESDSSCFSMIYNHLRTRLADETLNAILVIKQNLDLFDKVKFF